MRKEKSASGAELMTIVRSPGDVVVALNIPSHDYVAFIAISRSLFDADWVPISNCWIINERPSEKFFEIDMTETLWSVILTLDRLWPSWVQDFREREDEILLIAKMAYEA